MPVDSFLWCDYSLPSPARKKRQSAKVSLFLKHCTGDASAKEKWDELAVAGIGDLYIIIPVDDYSAQKKAGRFGFSGAMFCA